MSELSLDVKLDPRTKVPNVFPILDVEYKLAIVNGSPSEDDNEYGIPLVGKVGQILDIALANEKIMRTGCYVGQVLQIRPANKMMYAWNWSDPDVVEGMAQLKADLDKFNPNICLLLGQTAYAAAGGTGKIEDYRGSLFVSDAINTPFYGRKCIGTVHPSDLIMNWAMMPLFRFDLKRARAESEFPTLTLPERRLLIHLSVEEIIFRLDHWPKGKKMTLDIEGGLKGWSMVSIASSPYECFVITWSSFSFEDEVRVMKAFSRAMWDYEIPKVLQNCLYDAFVMAYGFRILLRNVEEDTMLKGWEIYSELPKKLGVQASIWTREPFYKDAVTHTKKAKAEALKKGVNIFDPDIKKIYCAKDSAVTAEIELAQAHHLSGIAHQHYRFNIGLLPSLLYMELRGHRYNHEKRDELLIEYNLAVNEGKTRLDVMSGGRDLYGDSGGFSNKKLIEYLYGVKGLPIQYAKEAGKKTEKVTVDKEALLQLYKKFDSPELYEILRIKANQMVVKYLKVGTDPDGRVRCGYNLVGTETGRMSCYTSPTGSGTNLTTITKKLRCLYMADEGYDYGQFDLAGADGWTVACRCAALGDNTMLEDYLYGIKPAKVIALMYMFPDKARQIAKMGRAELKELCNDKVKQSHWTYFASKRVQHGTNYLLGENTMSSQILQDSYKEMGEPIIVLPKDCKILQGFYLLRYGAVKERWHKWAENELMSKGRITSASGHTRIFFGRRKSQGRVDHQTLREFVADEPQQNTTFATNRAMERLWNDTENRTGHGSLIIEPLHQVHDAFNTQWPSPRREWALPKMKSYFDNPMTIAGIDITIPFEGGWGPDWGNVKGEI